MLTKLTSLVRRDSSKLRRGVGLRRYRALRDLVILVPLVAVVVTVLIKTDFFGTVLVTFAKEHEAYRIDELIVAAVPASIAIAWFSYRRWRDSLYQVRKREEVETDRDSLREQLTQVQKMKAMGELAGGIAHDFNNLLMIIDGYGQRARANLDDELATKEALDQIISAGQRGAALTRQLLVFSRRQVMEKAIVPVSELIDGIQGLLKHTIPERYEIRFDIEDRDVKIKTDPNEFVQALLNLVLNARDAMPDGGRIVISTKEIAATADEPSAVEFSIKDTGVGMDEETLGRIFEPFFTTKGREQGTGLGLAMVYGFVQSCDGRIDVSSTPGIGTEFLVRFPTTDASLIRAIEADAADQFGMGETILLVEDNEALLNLMKTQLEDLGYNVLSANGGFWALEIDEDYNDSIDLLVTDVIMPGMSGIELAKAMAESRPLMKTIFVSGYTDESKKTGSIPDGAVFLQKPVKAARLATVIRKVIEEDVELSQAS